MFWEAPVVHSEILEKSRKLIHNTAPQVLSGSRGTEGELEGEAEMEAVALWDIAWAFVTSPAPLEVCYLDYIYSFCRPTQWRRAVHGAFERIQKVEKMDKGLQMDGKRRLKSEWPTWIEVHSGVPRISE